MVKHYTSVITQEGNWFIARCPELDITSQGKTFEEAQADLQEAIALYLESFPEEDNE